MKTLLIFTAALLVSSVFNLTAQEKKLDSLKNLKSSIQVQIRNLQTELMSVNKQIENLEQQKNAVAQNTIPAKVSSGGAILRDAPNAMGNTVASIPGGASIQVFREQSNLYFKVSYNGKTGYVSYSTIEQNQAIDDYLSGKNNEVKSTSTTTIIRSVDEKDPKYQKLLKLYGKETAVRIMNGEVWNGMSPGMVLESKGKPVSKLTSTDATGNIETWNYSDIMVIFKNGEVSSFNKK